MASTVVAAAANASGQLCRNARPRATVTPNAITSNNVMVDPWAESGGVWSARHGRYECPAQRSGHFRPLRTHVTVTAPFFRDGDRTAQGRNTTPFASVRPGLRPPRSPVCPAIVHPAATRR